jgi:hypothetical protein
LLLLKLFADVLVLVVVVEVMGALFIVLNEVLLLLSSGVDVDGIWFMDCRWYDVFGTLLLSPRVVLSCSRSLTISLPKLGCKYK